VGLRAIGSRACATFGACTVSDIVSRNTATTTGSVVSVRRLANLKAQRSLLDANITATNAAVTGADATFHRNALE
jgi:hypothetical protein